MSRDIKNPLVALAFGGAVLLAGAVWSLATLRFTLSAEETMGEVTNTYSCRARRRTMLCGDIVFTTKEGRLGVVRKARGVRAEGARERVLYNPRNPEDARQAETAKTWAGPGVATVLGLIISGSGLRKFLNR